MIHAIIMRDRSEIYWQPVLIDPYVMGWIAILIDGLLTSELRFAITLL